MSLNATRRHLPLLAFAGALTASGFVSAQAADPRIALVLPGVKTDKSFNQAGYEGVKLAAEELKLEFAFSEKVPQPDQPEALADYARRGYKLVIGHGGEFQDAVDRVARRFPDTRFIVVNGVKAGGNVSTMTFDFKAMGYVMGFVAGKVSQSGKTGYIGAQKLKFYVELGEGFAAGAKAARPDGQSLSAWTNDWDDVAKGKEAALSLIGEGADVIFASMDNAVIGSYGGIKEKGKRAIGIYYDALSDWPDIMVQSAVFDMRHALVRILTDAKAGKLEGKGYIYGLETPDATRIGSFGPGVPEAVKTEMLAVIDGIKAGRVKVN